MSGKYGWSPLADVIRESVFIELKRKAEQMAEQIEMLPVEIALGVAGIVEEEWKGRLSVTCIDYKRHTDVIVRIDRRKPRGPKKKPPTGER